MLVYWRVDRIWKCQKISPRIGMVLKSPCSINYCTWWLYHTIQIDSDMGICIKIYRDRNGQKKHPSLQMENQPFVDHVPSEKNPWVFHICSYVFLRISSWKKWLIYCPLIFLLIPTKGREWGYDPIHNYCHLFITPWRWVWGSTMSGVEIPSGTPPRMPADTDLDQRRDTDGYGNDGDPQVVTIL
jgi:hypothetical protein